MLKTIFCNLLLLSSTTPHNCKSASASAQKTVLYSISILLIYLIPKPLLSEHNSTEVPLAFRCLSLHISELSPLILKRSPRHQADSTTLVPIPFTFRPSLLLQFIVNSSYFSAGKDIHFSC